MPGIKRGWILFVGDTSGIHWIASAWRSSRVPEDPSVPRQDQRIRGEFGVEGHHDGTPLDTGEHRRLRRRPDADNHNGPRYWSRVSEFAVVGAL